MIRAVKKIVGYVLGLADYLIKKILEVIFMSRFAQTFSRNKPCFKYNERRNILEPTDPIDLQEQVNSTYDETFFSRLERYYEENELTVEFVDEVAEYLGDDFGGAKADQMYKAFATVEDLRDRYGLPDEFSNSEIIAYVKKALEKKPNEEKGGEEDAQDDETKKGED